MIVAEFVDKMDKNVYHRERIILLKNGTLRVACGFEANGGKKLLFIGEENNDFMRERILKMNKYNQQ